jgi:hypothetical protein
MRVGRELLELALSTGARSLFVVGTGKNVGKTVTMRAVYEAASDAGIAVGLASIGRDGEAADAGDAQPKPRLWLRPPTVLATAQHVLPRSPASELLELSPLQTAAGPLVFARVRSVATYELVGPPTASGVRAMTQTLLAHSSMAIVDGAVDRIAPLAGGDDAIVLACGASASPTMQAAVDAIAALAARLNVEPYDPSQPAVHVEGALTLARAAEFAAAGERRQIVVCDPTQIALQGRAALQAVRALRIRCKRPLRIVAATVASIGRERAFEPRAFAAAVAAATGLPAFDVYAGTRAA